MNRLRITTALHESTDSAAHPTVTRIAAVAGLLLVTAFTFNKAPGGGFLTRALTGRLPASVPSDTVADIVKSAYTAVLALLAFGVARRRPAFFGMRRIGKQDVLAIWKALSVLFATVIVLRLLQQDVLPTAPAATDGRAQAPPLAYGLAGAVVAGLSEEFAYRGYLIEELGDLSGSRILAAAVSVVAFALAHVGSDYGWSLELLYPTLCGIALTALYLWRRNLWACVFMHIGLDALYAILHAT